MFIFSSNYTKRKRESPQEAETIFMKEVALFYLVYLFFLENQG